MENKSEQLNQLIKAVTDARSRVIDLCEDQLKDSPNWKVLRGRLLTTFGQRGLDGRVREILGTPLSPGRSDHE